MNKKGIVLILLLAFVLLLGGAYLLYNRLGAELAPDQLSAPSSVPTVSAPSESPTPSESAQPPKVPVPDFVIYDAENNEVRLSDFVGKPVVINFWASWCGPCKREMPDFQEKYLELGDEVHFLMINATDGSRETVETASQFIANQGYTFPVFYDTSFAAQATFGVYSYPTTYFLDAEGYGVVWAPGAISGEILQRCIDMILPPS